MLAILSSFFSKYIIYAVGIAVVIGLIFVTYLSWEHNIENKALIEYNQAQLVQAKQDIIDWQKKTQQIVELQTKTSADLAALQQSNDDLQNSINNFLDSPETTKKATAASEILKETFDKLKGQ